MTEGVNWVQFTKRTDEPKLNWLEYKLDELGIPNRRQGRSWHAPILQVPEESLERAWELLPREVDDLPDDHRNFLKYEEYISKSRQPKFY